MRSRRGTSERGQTAVLIAILIAGLLVLTGLAIDGGTAFLEHRRMQNAADFSALAGAQQVASLRNGNEVEDHDVARAVVDIAQRNGVLDTNENRNDLVNENVIAVYVDTHNVVVGNVGDGAIPADATGVAVEVEIERTAQLLQLVGVNTIPASANCLAQTGLYVGGVPPGGPPGDEDDEVGPPHALSFVQFEPDPDPDTEVTVTEPEPNPGGGEFGTTTIPRDPGEDPVYEFENKGHLIKFENATIGGEDAGLGEDGACETDTFEIVVEGSPSGFTFMTKAAGAEDIEWRSLGPGVCEEDYLLDSEAGGDPCAIKMEKTEFWIELSDHDGDKYTFKVHSCIVGQTMGPVEPVITE